MATFALAVEVDPAGIGPIDPGEDLHQRALARAVLADDAWTSPRPHVEARRPPALDAGEMLVDSPHAEEHFMVLDVFKLVHRNSNRRGTTPVLQQERR